MDSLAFDLHIEFKTIEAMTFRDMDFWLTRAVKHQKMRAATRPHSR